MARHKLTEKNFSTMTAMCSVDGLVGLRKAGKSVRCATANSAAQKAWAQANPEKARANRRLQSDHRLDGETCSVCGPVDTVPWGRGVACGNRARQLRSKQQKAVSRPCPDCLALDGRRIWIRGDGTCPRCTDTAMHYEFVPPERRDIGGRLNWTLVQLDALDIDPREEPYGSGYSISHGTVDPESTPKYESAVRGWKTVGSTRPWNEVA